VRNVRIEYNGAIEMVRREILEMNCPLDTHMYPFDTQTCRFTLSPRIMQINIERGDVAGSDMGSNEGIKETNGICKQMQMQIVSCRMEHCVFYC
jgi:hypothetical protein